MFAQDIRDKAEKRTEGLIRFLRRQLILFARRGRKKRFVDSRDVANDCPGVAEAITNTLELDPGPRGRHRSERYVERCVGDEDMFEDYVDKIT